MRRRTSFFVSARVASLISFSRPTNSPDSSAAISAPALSMASLRSALMTMCVAGSSFDAPTAADPLEDVVAVVEDRRVLQRLAGAGLGDQVTLERDRLLDPDLRGLEPGGDHLFADLRSAVLVVLPRPLGAARLDHHDRDVAIGELSAGDDELERAAVTLLVGGMGDPLAVGAVGDADRADRAVERDARDHEDADAALIASTSCGFS